MLGPVAAWRGGAAVNLGRPQQCAVLLSLLMRFGSYVSLGRIIEGVWGDNAVATAEKTIRTYVYRLRRELHPSGVMQPQVITSAAGGYIANISPDAMDSCLFEAHLKEAIKAREGGNQSAASRHLQQALTIWDGRTPMPGIPGEFAQSQRSYFEELWNSALEMRLSLDLERGLASSVIAELASLVTAHPADERFRALYMMALYRNDRRADALNTYIDARVALADTLGIDPGGNLQELYMRMLRDDPQLIPRATVSSLKRPSPPVVTTREIAAQLPSDLSVFAGRHAELAVMDRFLEPDDESTRLLVVSGLGGSGKSALAVHWAHRIKHRYPDGQIYINLRDISGPDVIMHTSRLVLEAFGIDRKHTPDDAMSRNSCYRSLLSGRRFLLYLDDAENSEQVQELVPASNCLVLVTSRNRLSELAVTWGAENLHLAGLPAGEAQELFTKRLKAESLSKLGAESIDRISQASGGHALTLAAIAAYASQCPEASLAEIDGLIQSGDLLSALDLIDERNVVRQVLDATCTSLDRGLAELLRFVADMPRETPCVPEMVAARTGRGLREVRKEMHRLQERSLLVRVAGFAYDMPVLVREYLKQEELRLRSCVGS